MVDAFGNPGDDGILSNDIFLFNNQAANVGDTINLGSYAINTELMFRLFVNDTGFNFYTGAASRNPNNQAHARVQQNWMPNTTLVSFEDLETGPYIFNDLSFSFTNTVSNQVSSPAAGALALMFGGLVFAKSKRRKKTV